MLSCRLAIPALLRAGEGSLVNIASIRALSGTPSLVAYSCAKAGVVALTRHIAATYGPQNIRANAVAPGLIVNETVRDRFTIEKLSREIIHGDILLPREGEPADIAAVSAFLLSSDSKYITGQTITVDGGELSHYRIRQVSS